MERPDDRTGTAPDAAGLSSLERSLRRALATAESEETRFHIRTALQQLAVVREGGAATDPSTDPPAERH